MDNNFEVELDNSDIDEFKEWLRERMLPNSHIIANMAVRWKTLNCKDSDSDIGTIHFIYKHDEKKFVTVVNSLGKRDLLKFLSEKVNIEHTNNSNLINNTEES